MTVATTYAPAAPRVSSSLVATSTGLADAKTRFLLDDVVFATICSPTAGEASGTGTTRSTAGTQTLDVEQFLSGAWSNVDSESVTVVSTPTDPSAGATWHTVPPSLIAAIPGGAITYSSGTLAAFLASIPANGWGVLDTDATFTENINLALRDGVTIIADTGRTPEIDGSLRISGGVGARIFGLNVTWTGADPDGHMVKLDGGQLEYAYAEIHDAACFTLMRPGQALRNSRLHHLWIHDNPGITPGTGNHDGNTDHGLYIDPPNASANILIDHCLVETMPRGRNIKIGGPSSGYSPIGGITISKVTLIDGQGPSNAQVSNGATGIHFEYSVFIDSGASTNLTAGSGAGTGSSYDHCAGDSIVGPNNAQLDDGGSNLDNVAGATIANAATQAAAGRGYLAT